MERKGGGGREVREGREEREAGREDRIDRKGRGKGSVKETEISGI